MTTGADTLKSLFEVGQPALQNTWAYLEKQYGGSTGLIQKVISNLSEPIKEKVKAMNQPDILKPGNSLGIECPVEYAFVLTPIEYLKIEPGTSSSLNWNTQFWMGANEGAVLNRASLVTAKKRLEQFDKAMENSPLKGSAIYKEARAILVAATLKGEMYWIQNLTHRDLPDSAFLDHNQFGITTPQKYA